MLVRKRKKIYSRLKDLQKYIEKIDKRDNKSQSDWDKTYDELAHNFSQLSNEVTSLTETVRKLNKEEENILKNKILLSGPGTEEGFVGKKRQTTISYTTESMLDEAIQKKTQKGWTLVKRWKDELKERYIALLVEN